MNQELNLSSTCLPEGYDPHDPVKELAWFKYISETLTNIFYDRHTNYASENRLRNRLCVGDNKSSHPGERQPG